MSSNLPTNRLPLQVMAVVFGWWIVRVALMKAWIAWWPLHHMRLTVHHVAHRFWTVGGRRTCVRSENYLRVDGTVHSPIFEIYSIFFLWRLNFAKCEKWKWHWINGTFGAFVCAKHLRRIHIYSR